MAPIVAPHSSPLACLAAISPLAIPLEERTLGPIIHARAQQHPQRIYLAFQEERWTYGAFFLESQALARGLRALGVQPQERVALLMDNRSEFMLAYWALACLNATIVPINPALRGDALGYVVADSGVVHAIVAGELVEAVHGLRADSRHKLRGVTVLDGAARGPLPCGEDRFQIVDWHALLDSHREGEPLCAHARFDDVHLLSYTSGTTGPPKGVLIPYAQSLQTSLSCIEAVGMGPEDVIYAPLPLFHGMSRTMGTVPALLLGAQVHVAPRFSGSRFWREVANAGATVAVTIFTIPPTLKNQPPSPLDRSHGLRVMFNAHHDQDFEQRFGTRIVEAHGMTEVGITVYSPWPERREGSAGRAGPDWEVVVVDEQDRPVPPGVVGEMVMRPRHPALMMLGYLNKPEQTAAATRNLWFHSGDYMRMDEDGFFYFAGRKKERIRRRGENISAYEIETCADRHPDVVECAAVPYPAGDGEDDVRLAVVRLDGSQLDAAGLAAWMDGALARFMRPRYIHFVDQLPKTGTGKLEKYRIADSPLPPGCWDREAVSVTPAAEERAA